MAINRDPEIINELLTRSISKIYPSKESLQEALSSGKPMRVYVGIDPTATYVHLGHSTNYILLKKFHDLGHKIIVLIGDFTARIGDPSDKTALRKKLSIEEIKNNLKTFKEQIGKIIDFEDKKNPVEFAFNSKWLKKLLFEDVLEITSNFTLQQMVERDAFQKRIKENKPLHLHELFYPIMQGYDSVALNADIEIGGTDQTFNMLAGRILVKNIQNREKFVITTTLLENPVTGEKLMSKSLGTGIGLNESPMNIYGKAMSLPDEVITRCFIDCTFWPVDKIKKTEKEIGKLKPRDFKMMLAHEIVKMYHGEKKAGEAEEFFIKTFQKKEIPEEIPEIRAEKGEKLADVLIKEGIIKSKSEWRRLVDEQAIHDLGNKIEINDYHFKVEKETILKIGKKRFIKIKQ